MSKNPMNAPFVGGVATGGNPAGGAKKNTSKVPSQLPFVGGKSGAEGMPKHSHVKVSPGSSRATAKNPAHATFPGSKAGAQGMPKHSAKKVSPSSMKVKASGPVAPKRGITSTEQIVDYRKRKYGI